MLLLKLSNISSEVACNPNFAPLFLLRKHPAYCCQWYLALSGFRTTAWHRNGSCGRVQCRNLPPTGGFRDLDVGVFTFLGMSQQRKSRQYRPVLPTRVWTRHFPDEMGLPNPPKCRSQKVRIIKCKPRADRSKPVGLLVCPPAALHGGEPILTSLTVTTGEKKSLSEKACAEER